MTPSGEIPLRFERRNIHELLRAWDDQNREPKDRFPWITDQVEVPFAVRLGEKLRCACTHHKRDHEIKPSPKCAHHGCSCPHYRPLYFSGVKDLVGRVRDSPKEVCVVDHKSTGRMDFAFRNSFHLSSQLTGYIWAENTERPCFTAYINAIELGVLPTSDRKCKNHGVKYSECSWMHLNALVIGPFTRTKGQLESWRSDAIEIAASYYHSLQQNLNETTSRGQFTDACGRCEYQKWCLADRPLKPLNGWFRKHEWAPWKDLKIPSNALVVDNSILKSHVTCATQARVRYGSHLTTPDQILPLLAGTAIHVWYERWFAGKSLKQCFKAFDESYEIN